MAPHALNQKRFKAPRLYLSDPKELFISCPNMKHIIVIFMALKVSKIYIN